MSIGRKAHLAWAAFVMENIWLGFDKLDAGTYVALTTMIFGLYVGANVMAKRTT